MSLARYRCVMSNVLQDSRLVDLQKEGGASLCLLRREESSFNQTDDYRYRQIHIQYADLSTPVHPHTIYYLMQAAAMTLCF